MLHFLQPVVPDLVLVVRLVFVSFIRKANASCTRKHSSQQKTALSILSAFDRGSRPFRVFLTYQEYGTTERERAGRGSLAVSLPMLRSLYHCTARNSRKTVYIVLNLGAA